jgi:ankyrin repeat protein
MSCFGEDFSERFENMVEAGNLNWIKKVIAGGYKPTNDSFKKTSVIKNQFNVFKYFVEDLHHDPNCEDNFALMWFAYHGNLEAIEYLYSIGCDIRTKNDDALMYSLGQAKVPVAKFLLRFYDHTNERWINWALRHNRLEISKYILTSLGRKIYSYDDQNEYIADSEYNRKIADKDTTFGKNVKVFLDIKISKKMYIISKITSKKILLQNVIMKNNIIHKIMRPTSMSIILTFV